MIAINNRWDVLALFLPAPDPSRHNNFDETYIRVRANLFKSLKSHYFKTLATGAHSIS
jgi:hypothetical protein